jgi:phage terminase small subunit
MQETAENGTVLTPKQERLLVALLRSKSVEAAAEQAGVAPRTAWSYLKQPAFKAALRERRCELLQQTTNCLVSGATEATTALRAVVTNSMEPAAARVAAARALLEHVWRAHEVGDLADRLAQLEALALRDGAA